MTKKLTKLFLTTALSLTGGTCLALASTYGYTGPFLTSDTPDAITTIETEHKGVFEIYENSASIFEYGIVSDRDNLNNGSGETPNSIPVVLVDVDDGINNMEIECDELLPSISSSELCEGELLNLYVSSINGGAISWDIGVTNGVPFSPAVGITTYTATSDYHSDCSFSVDVEVFELPDITIAASDSAICVGDSMILTGEGADFYSWDLAMIVDGEAFFPSEGINTYTLTGTDENGCINTAAIEITVYELPVINILASSSDICYGESFILSGVDAVTFEWDMDIEDGEIVTPTGPGTTTYTVIGIDSNGCAGTSSVDITVHDLPEVFATIDTDAICFGFPATLTGSGAITYSWDIGATNGVAFTPITIGAAVYTVTGTDAYGCQNEASVELMINALPIITASVNDANTCIGEPFIFTAEGVDDFDWDMGVIDGEEYTPGGIETMTYTVTGVDENGCVNSASIDATMHLLPVVVATADQDSICYGEFVTFSGEGADSYVWAMDVLDGIPYSPATAGTITYAMIGTDIYGCVNASFVTVNMNEVINLSCTISDEIGGGDGSVNLSISGGSPSYTFDWNNDGTTDFDDTEDMTGLIAGEYTVVVRDSRLCEQSHTSSINSQLGLDTDESASLAIYPNPFNDFITIKFQGDFNYEIYTINGEIIENGSGTNQKALNMRTLASGVYFIQIGDGVNTATQKIVKN
ncbi:MAG: hypothetical protein ACI8ZM_002397 [Crocinitomix sp.]|jgi:hypothetical protein